MLVTCTILLCNKYKFTGRAVGRFQTGVCLCLVLIRLFLIFVSFKEFEDAATKGSDYINVSEIQLPSWKVPEGFVWNTTSTGLFHFSGFVTIVA